MKEVIRMKKLNRILSSVLVVSVLISCFAMNVFAASKAHTVTIKPATTEGLKAGDTLVVELIMDNTEKLVSCQYSLTYDPTAFYADTTKPNRLENCIDKTWLDGMKDTDGDWGYYLGNPVYNVANAGTMEFSWAGTEGVEADYAMDNRVIGKFNLTVKDGVADGTYTFSLTGNTLDSGENSKADMVTVPVTVTVGEEEPDEEVFEIKDTAAELAGNEKMKIKDETTGELKVVDATVAAGDKVVAIFSKDIEDGNDLAAESYGIIFGGKRYPGVAEVPDGYSWAVKLVGPASKLPAGNYTYGIFAAGQEDLNAGTYEVK